MFMEAQTASLIEQEPSRYEALIHVSHAIRAHRDPAELFQVLRNELRNVVKFDSIGIVQYDEVGNEIAWHLAERCKQMRDGPREVPQEETIPWWVYQNQQAVMIPCFERETRFPRAVDEIRTCGIRSGCAFPLTTVQAPGSSFSRQRRRRRLFRAGRVLSFSRRRPDCTRGR
jgi:hypothetical protein